MGGASIGPAIRYGDVSESHRERFEPGAFDLGDGRTRYLDVRHDPERVIAYTGGGGLELRDTPGALEVTATLPRIPAADRALAEVRDGRLRGFSIEFHAESERRESRNPRGVQGVAGRCRAGGASELRPDRRRRFGREGRGGSCRSGSNLSCECHDGSCDAVNIKDVELPKDRDVIAVAGNYTRAVGSVKRGSLKLEKTADGLAVDLTCRSTGHTGRAGAGGDGRGGAAVREADLPPGRQRRD